MNQNKIEENIAERNIDDLILTLSINDCKEEDGIFRIELSKNFVLTDRSIGELLILNGLIRRQKKSLQIYCNIKTLQHCQNLQMNRILSFHLHQNNGSK